MSKFPHGGEVLGASPGHPLLAPVLRHEMVLSRQQALLDQQAIQRIPGLAGYWPADPAYLYQDSAGYIPASVGGVVGQVRDISNAATPVARRNLLTYSEQLDNAAWGRLETTISANDTIAPDGTTTADKIVDSTTYSQHYLEQPGLPTTNGTYTYSLYVKDGGSPTFVATVVHLGLGNNTSNIVFSVTGGVVAYFSGATAQVVSGSVQVTPVDNGFYRVQFAYTLSGTVTGHWARISAKQTSSYAGDGTSGIYIWGAQLEVGSEATPYQKIVTGTGDVFAPGNHAYQQTTANKPYLRKTPTSNVYWLDANTANSAITATLGNLGSACTVAKAGAEGVTFTEGVTISSTYNIAPAFGFNGDIAIFNRALTASEKALLTRYMSRGVPVLGANLVANGTFDSDTTGWTATNASLSVVDGRLVVTSSANGATTVVQVMASSVNTQILVKVDLYAETVTGNLFFTAFTQPANAIIGFLNSDSLSTKQMCFLAQTATTKLQAGSSVSTLIGETFTLDNFVARQIL